MLRRTIFLLIATGLLFTAALASAHGGAHKKPDEAPAADAPSPYALEPSADEKPLADDDLLSPFSRGDMLGGDTGESMGHEMGHDMGHDMGGMPEVELSHHTLVSTSKTGYPWAVAVTALSGLVFGILAFRRG